MNCVYPLPLGEGKGEGLAQKSQTLSSFLAICRLKEDRSQELSFERTNQKEAG